MVRSEWLRRLRPRLAFVVVSRRLQCRRHRNTGAGCRDVRRCRFCDLRIGWYGCCVMKSESSFALISSS